MENLNVQEVYEEVLDEAKDLEVTDLVGFEGEEDVYYDEIVDEDETPKGIGAFGKVAIGAGVVALGFGAYKLGKKVVNKIKNKGDDKPKTKKKLMFVEVDDEGNVISTPKKEVKEVIDVVVVEKTETKEEQNEE